MPTLRSNKKRAIDVESQEEMKITKKEELSQWLMLLPDSIKDGTFVHLPHPQNGASSMFLFHTKEIYELIKYKSDFASWFVGDTVQKDGSLYMASRIDPLFLALPYLIKSAESGKYLTLDHILSDSKFPSGIEMLEKALTHKTLMKLCSSKGDEDFTAYKLEETKLLSWLQKKVSKLAAHFQNSNINLTSCGQISSFVRHSSGHKNEDVCLSHAWVIVSDYLQPGCSAKLKSFMGIKDLAKEIKKDKVNDTEPPSKRQKVDGVGENRIEDYRENNNVTKKESAATTKMSARQKSLLKVDKKGMKTMSSFFTKSAKK